MGVKKDLTDALRIAIKENNYSSKNALRLALTSIKLAEIEIGKNLEDVRIFSILQKEIKTREETINEALNAGRESMIEPLNYEINILKGFLPSELSDDELLKIVKTVISDQEASTLKQMGIVIKTVIEKVQGRASNERISRIVRSLLSTD